MKEWLDPESLAPHEPDVLESVTKFIAAEFPDIVDRTHWVKTFTARYAQDGAGRNTIGFYNRNEDKIYLHASILRKRRRLLEHLAA